MTDRTEVSQCQIFSYTLDERVTYTHFTTKRAWRGLASPGVMVPTARPTGGYSGASTTVMPRKDRIDGIYDKGIVRGCRKLQGHMTRIGQVGERRAL
jgi:hypothetical protein